MQPSAYVILAATAIATVPALADRLPLPKAAYSADVTIETKGREYTGRIVVDGPKERRDVIGPGGAAQVTIIRRDIGKVYDLRPKRHLAVALRMAAAEAAGETGSPGTDIDSFYGVEAAKEGNETIAGQETTKYHINLDSGPGLSVDATVWATDDGIVVKCVGKTSIDGDNAPASIELTHIARGPQDPALFEVPQGMTIMSPDSDEPPDPRPNSQ
jgi:hypothetical protein